MNLRMRMCDHVAFGHAYIDGQPRGFWACVYRRAATHKAIYKATHKAIYEATHKAVYKVTIGPSA